LSPPSLGIRQRKTLAAGKLESKLLDLGARCYCVPRHLADDALERIAIIRQQNRSAYLERSFLVAAMPR
jgi:hypothetical protein